MAHGDYASSVPSPCSDSNEDSGTKFASFLKRLACQSGLEVNVVTVEHAYAKPSNCRSENAQARPTRTLFVSHIPSHREARSHIDAEVDVDGIEETAAPLYNAVMGDCDVYISSTKPEDEEEDWEQCISKTGWTSVQHRVFGRMVRILNDDRLARLTCEGVPNESIQRRNIVGKSTHRMRQLLAHYGWETSLTQWLHVTLLENLSSSYLTIYLNILQCLRAKIPELVDRLIAISPVLRRAELSGLESLNVILKPPWDPVASSLNNLKPRRLPENPVLLMVPSSPVSRAPSSRKKMWENYFSSLGIVSSVPGKSEAECSKQSLATCLDQMLVATRLKVAHLRAQYPGKPIILVGWNCGATLACHIALVEPVTAVVCLGFAVNTMAGKRGEPDDILLDLTTPVLFVIGENAATTRQEDMEDLREKLRVETGLVIVGGADDLLRVSSSKRFTKGVTQSMVDCCIQDEVGNFLGSILMHPRPVNVRPNTHMSSDGEKRKMMSSELAGKRLRPGPRPKPRVTAAQKLQSNPGSPEVKWARGDPDQASKGITVNIGSLGSLTPLGHIRLSQSNPVSSSRPLQGNVVSSSMEESQSPNRPSSLQQRNPATRIMVSSSSGQVVGGTTSGRVVDFSKLTVLTPSSSSGNVVLPYSLVPGQRSYTIVPKITVPSLKLNNSVSHVSDTGAKDEENVLSAAKILDLPIIFAKDGEDPMLTEDKLSLESLESPTVVPICSCESSSAVTVSDTISFPLESESEKTKTVPNVFIIRSKDKPASHIKYTKIILSNSETK